MRPKPTVRTPGLALVRGMAAASLVVLVAVSTAKQHPRNTPTPQYVAEFTSVPFVLQLCMKEAS